MIKRKLIDLFIRFLHQQDIMHAEDRLFALRHRHLPPISNLPSPYTDLACARERSKTLPAVFITGRFRSGSTLLWNIFRQMKGCTAYYEPLNERRWFDAAHRGEKLDSSHRGVANYWLEYDGLGDLNMFYRDEWVHQGLYMDSCSHDPALRNYIQALIDAAAGTAVLQFNRVDFRLPWLRAEFPDVPVVHLYRHPRDQWLSFLADEDLMAANRVEQTYKDGFYLDMWCRDLARHFPYLDPIETPHPYQRFYYLWKLSWLFAEQYATTSLRFEDLVKAPRESLAPTLDAIAWQNEVDWTAIEKMISAPAIGRWRDYADDEWFAAHESACETTLTRYLPKALES